LKEERAPVRAKAKFGAILVQIAILDIVLSLDSAIAAVGLAKDVAVMIFAIIAAAGVMMISSKSIGNFVDRHPTIKMLALSFPVMIGVALIAEGFAFHIPKGGYLLCHGVFRRRRNAEHQDVQTIGQARGVAQTM
jgi:predicted tellurium resistance membrane protein TerC